MAGSATVERGARQEEPSGPPLVRRLGGPRRVRMIIALGLAVLLLGAGTVWVLYGSSWTKVEHVSVSGTDVLTPDQVREAAAVPVGSPLVSVDTKAIEARLRTRLPRIDTVDVMRSWPHGIGLKVTERQPVLLVGKGSNFVEVDDKGVRFATISQALKNVPLLELALSGSGSGGSGAASLRRFGEDRLVREAVRVAGDIPDAVAQKTRALKVRSYDDISLELTDGRTVAWGSAEKGALKARTLGALMKASPGARHFDVSAPTAPASSGS
ncbi:cell division protein FtsQ/DivIB [Streptomyces sp. NBC_00582]|uniref:cell division protein FtsQ/DivIB n=1 Tax=Streptomyces sp. NBC_00582 TaxID=2975783 RepID=UPI002E804A1A|nr:FtsQ-type POTRA domain-containing protein [Streptomyces sp. NBC_00582]WUB65352.1 FtsQ-type POTRA domain-containing protein [Streptomyces sp. NBC_00582]